MNSLFGISITKTGLKRAMLLIMAVTLVSQLVAASPVIMLCMTNQVLYQLYAATVFELGLIILLAALKDKVAKYFSSDAIKAFIRHVTGESEQRLKVDFGIGLVMILLMLFMAPLLPVKVSALFIIPLFFVQLYCRLPLVELAIELVRFTAAVLVNASGLSKMGEMFSVNESLGLTFGNVVYVLCNSAKTNSPAVMWESACHMKDDMNCAFTDYMGGSVAETPTPARS